MFVCISGLSIFPFVVRSVFQYFQTLRETPKKILQLDNGANI